ncbi:carbohydrate sulfotransferase 12-like isoform X2 [Cherax quadricarinatus]|uniref:carbohydrate sulfotransferase 12-like isoform X2 n=1 Tax=Cherax quadricarinatus TaxID=27406 RepID=UPI002379DD93|nr:uncharacterized protein LOC128702760 isoform X2 [Cherax quadricarinatus]
MMFRRSLKGLVGASALFFLVFHLLSFYIWKAWETKTVDKIENAGIHIERLKSVGCSESNSLGNTCQQETSSSPERLISQDAPYDRDSEWTMNLILDELDEWLKNAPADEFSKGKSKGSVDFPQERSKLLEEFKDKTGNTTTSHYELPLVKLLKSPQESSTSDLSGSSLTEEQPNTVVPHEGVYIANQDENLSSTITELMNHANKTILGQDLPGTASRENLSQDDPLLPGPTINKSIQKQMLKDSPLVSLRRDVYWPIVLPPTHASIFTSVNFSRYSPEDRQYLEGRVSVYEERARRVGKVCENNLAHATPTPVKTLVWDQKHQPNLVWCQMSKVASTTWMVNFLRLAHYRENDTSLAHLSEEERDKARFEQSQFVDVNLHSIVYRFFPAPDSTRERNRIFREALRVIIVRHPFARYRSKTSNETSVFPTFEEFTQFVIDSTANLKTLKEWKKVVCWTPYWAQCGVCAHDFQLIMKLETMEEDERFLITLADLQELKEVHEKRNVRSSPSTSHHKYFQQLSTHQMLQLHQRYLLDFQLFGYSLEEYLPLARDAPVQRPAS